MMKLVALCLVAAASAQPSIEANGNDVLVNAPQGDVQFSLGTGSERTVTLSDLLARINSLESTVASQAADLITLRRESVINLTPAGSADGAAPATITAVRDDDSGVGLTIASVQPAGDDEGESSHGEVFIDSAGNVGLGITDPRDRLSVDGNIRATGEITVDNVNVLELLRETRESLASFRNTVLGNTSHVYRSCNQAYTNMTANGETPTSGVYTVQPRGLLSADTWQVWCEMRADGGWLRVGRNATQNFQNAYQNIYDAQFITQDDTEVIAGHVAGLGAFNDVEVDCNVDFAMQADNVENDHRVFYVSIDNLKAGHFSTSQIGEMRMGQGKDHTVLMNRPASSCDGCCDELASSNPDPVVYGTCMNPFQDRGSVLNPNSPYYAGPRVEATFPGSCTAIMCQSKSRIPLSSPNSNSCGVEGKPERGQTIENVVFTRLEFRPSTTNCGPWRPLQCNRHRFNFIGDHYYVYLK